MKTDDETRLANQIRDELRYLRERLAQDPEKDPLIWPIPNTLACSQRPLRDHPTFGGRGKPLPPEAGPLVVAWVRRISAVGVRSVICLTHRKELSYYQGLSGMSAGLLALYNEVGLRVSSIEWADPAHARTSEERQALRNRVEYIKHEAYEAFKELPKPVLLHCSAGIDRSAPVAAHILVREMERLAARKLT